MADYAHEYTDHEIVKLNKQIQNVYKEAEKDIQKKMDDFNAKYKAKEQKYQQKVNSGQMSQEDFDRWKKGQVFQGQQWQAKKEQILDTMHHSNEIATNMINDKTQNVFMTNANYMSYDMEHGAGINFGFGVYDSNTVSKLIKDDPQLLPKWKIDEPKDYKWSQKKLNNAITQGIIQGESLDKIAKRLSNKLASTNENKMKTFARTAMTGAQNSGRQMQLENAKKMGIDLMKEWMATLDSHTRDSHADVDGEQVEVDKRFSNGLMFPGEPGGAPAEVYNCFIPETNIASDSEIIRSYKHYYSGKVVSIKSAGGVNFSCTPNHPILTDRGWIAAKFLNNGDHLIVTSGVNNEVSRRNPNINHAFPRIDAIHELFYKLGGKRTSELRVNFHGDIPTGEVEIITQKRFLWSDFNISVRKYINKFLLKYANSPLMCKCSFMEHFRRIVRTTFSNIRRMSDAFSFIKWRVCHSCIHGLRTIANRNVVFGKNATNNLPRNVILPSEIKHGLARKIFLDDIISVDVSDFTGHVYNLQTKNNYYFVNNNTNNTKLYNGIFAIAHNCRCTMVSEIKKYPSKYERYDNIAGKRIDNMSYEDWVKAKGMEKKSVENYKTKEPAKESILMSIKNGLSFDDFDFETLVKAKDEAGFEGNNWNFFQKYKNGDIDSKTLDEVLLNSNKTIQTEMHKTVQGKDISNAWVRRSDKFNFAIDDILNAQGFDGLPQVVNSNEFDKLAKESNFIMQRTYSAPSQEVLNEYRNQLYNGKWYVDCSTGGAAYGEGMYTFSANSATVTEDIKNNIDAFRSQPHTTDSKFNNVETMTLTKDAKIISTDDLLAKFENEVEKYAKENGIDYFDAEDIFAEKFYNRHNESGYVIDLGAYGSAKGYDAITSYDVTVVLNRTKLVIKGE